MSIEERENHKKKKHTYPLTERQEHVRATWRMSLSTLYLGKISLYPIFVRPMCPNTHKAPRFCKLVELGLQRSEVNSLKSPFCSKSLMPSLVCTSSPYKCTGMGTSLRDGTKLISSLLLLIRNGGERRTYWYSLRHTAELKASASANSTRST